MLKTILAKLKNIQGDVGKIGEKKALQFLQKKGYKILEQNFKAHPHEIDIICYDPQNKEIVFVEVKTRINDNIENNFEAFHQKKQNYIKKCAEKYLSKTQNWDKPCRFDLICINGTKYQVEHFTNVIE